MSAYRESVANRVQAQVEREANILIRNIADAEGEVSRLAEQIKNWQEELEAWKDVSRTIARFQKEDA